METFVVRVRESGQGEPGLRGVVDEVASGYRATFHNAEELVMILTSGSRGQARAELGQPSCSPKDAHLRFLKTP